MSSGCGCKEVYIFLSSYYLSLLLLYLFFFAAASYFLLCHHAYLQILFFVCRRRGIARAHRPSARARNNY